MPLEANIMATVQLLKLSISGEWIHSLGGIIPLFAYLIAIVLPSLSYNSGLCIHYFGIFNLLIFLHLSNIYIAIVFPLLSCIFGSLYQHSEISILFSISIIAIVLPSLFYKLGLWYHYFGISMFLLNNIIATVSLYLFYISGLWYKYSGTFISFSTNIIA